VQAPFLSLRSLIEPCSQGLPSDITFPDNALDLIGAPLRPWLLNLLARLGVQKNPVILGKVSPHAIIEGAVFIAEGAHVEPTAYIQGPCYIGPHAEVRHGAYIRGDVFVGSHAVVGHTSEIKGSVLFDHAKAAHFAYVGNSILGHRTNLGAGTKLANLKLRNNEVKFRDLDGKVIPSGLRKFGAILGDDAQTGCNSVLSPGTLLGRKALIMPCAHAHGTILAPA
jgi:NDP-sugar pyrophosphorylase family protein